VINTPRVFLVYREKYMKNNTNITKYRYLSVIYNVFFTPFFTNSRKKAFLMISPNAGDKVLLAGVGTGLDLKYFKEGVKVTGIDISEDMLNKAQEKNKAIKADLKIMNAEELLFDNSTFDYVVLNLILSVVENPKKAMSEAVRVLKPGGTMLVWDKFMAKGSLSPARKLFNKITSFIGTDITRVFEDIAQGQDITLVSDKGVMMGNNFRVILFKK